MTFPSWKYDIDRLLGENEKLRTEIERLRHDNMRLKTANDCAYDPRDGELSRLNRNILQLRAALRKIADETNCERGPWCREIARRAREPKLEADERGLKYWPDEGYP